MQVLFVNEAVPVLVDHVEGLLEFLDLRLIEHGKYIGSGALRALLGGLCLCPFARHGGCWFSKSSASESTEPVRRQETVPVGERLKHLILFIKKL